MVEIISTFKNPIRITEIKNIDGSIYLPFIKCLKVTGKDAMSFINNIASFYIKKLKDGYCEHGLFLNKLGKIIMDAYLYKLDLNTLYLVVLDYNLEKFVKYVNNLILTNNVKIEEVQNFKYIVVPHIPKLDSNDKNPDIQVQENTIIGKGYYVTSNDIFFIGEPNIKYDNIDIGKEDDIKAINLIRLKNKIPYNGVDFGEDILANEIMEWIDIDVSKGCFIGQEYVSRIKFRGKVHKKLVYFSTKASTTEKISKEILNITSSYYDNETDEICGFGYLNLQAK